jgi:hypothetical protein
VAWASPAKSPGRTPALSEAYAPSVADPGDTGHVAYPYIRAIVRMWR